MQLQVNARKQALKEGEVHTPTFSAPVFSTHDSVPRLTGAMGPPSPTAPGRAEGNLNLNWDISFIRKEEDAQKLDDSDIVTTLWPRAPSIDEHARLAKLVVKLCSKRNKELRRKISKDIKQSTPSTVEPVSAKRPVEDRLQRQLDRYQRTLASKNSVETDEVDMEMIRSAKSVFSYAHLRDRVRVDTCSVSESGDDPVDFEG
ncbi:hypothetical protein QR46_1753 [Giardia duodenalis assemblage B]|uniref:Uncharacterized protein n=1 Tax=Giardia duodenalis assemblage B TaxID=1394984 RepID=A0A132NW19_GIAIN|nr:hypothetical protein QR46_1753 [Giardia intestinalis assemblage B]